MGSPAVCDATTAFVKEAMSMWAPSRHELYRLRFQEGIHTVMLASQRLRDHGSKRVSRRRAVGLPVLPAELWLTVYGFHLRRHWTPV